MAMSRKHYVATAEALKVIRPDFPESDYYYQEMPSEVWCECVEAIARVFRSDNSRFSYDLFYEACGYTEMKQKVDEWNARSH